jgi:hypothetical protein
MFPHLNSVARSLFVAALCVAGAGNDDAAVVSLDALFDAEGIVVPRARPEKGRRAASTARNGAVEGAVAGRVAPDVELTHGIRVVEVEAAHCKKKAVISTLGALVIDICSLTFGLEFEDCRGFAQASQRVVVVDCDARHVGRVRPQVGNGDGREVKVLRPLRGVLLAGLPPAAVHHLVHCHVSVHVVVRRKVVKREGGRVEISLRYDNFRKLFFLGCKFEFDVKTFYPRERRIKKRVFSILLLFFLLLLLLLLVHESKNAFRQLLGIQCEILNCL